MVKYQPLAENLCRTSVKETLKPDIGCRTIYKRLNDQSRGHVESTREYNFGSLSIRKITLWSFRCLFVLRFRGLKTYPHADAKQRKTKKWPDIKINKMYCKTLSPQLQQSDAAIISKEIKVMVRMLLTLVPLERAS